MKQFTIIISLIFFYSTSFGQSLDIKLQDSLFVCVFKSEHNLSMKLNCCNDTIFNKDVLKIILQSKEEFQQYLKLSNQEVENSECLFPPDSSFFVNISKILSEKESIKNKICIITLFENRQTQIRFGMLRVFTVNNYSKYSRRIKEISRLSNDLSEPRKRRKLYKLFKNTSQYLFVLSVDENTLLAL